MIDIHNHLLPGMDDGAESARETARMISIAVKEGITDIVSTCHVEAGMGPEYMAKYKECFGRVQDFIARREISLHIYPGQELFYTDGIVDALQREEVLTMNGTKHILVEFPVFESYQYIERALYRLQNAGYWPILAHVERYHSLRDWKLIGQLREQGACIQVNASAVMGKAGHMTKWYCKQLLRKQYVDVIATDAHGSKHRRPLLKECQAYVKRKFGKEYAKLVLETNPRKVLKGERICGKD